MVGITTFLLAILCLAVVASSRRRHTTRLPRVGKAGPLGYVWIVIRSVFDCNSVVEEGCKQFKGQPFVFPTLGGEIVILGPDNTELLRRSDDSVFNGPERAKQLFQINLQFGDITTNPYHLESILRSDLTRALTSLTPDLLDETQMVLPEAFKMKNSDFVIVPVFDTMINLVARVANRVMIGAPGCRDTKFLGRQVSLATQVISLAQVLNWFPDYIKPVVFRLTSLFAGGSKAVVDYLTPYVETRIQEAQQGPPKTISDILFKFAPEEDLLEPKKVAVRVAHLNMASIHTSAIFVTQSLFELALLEPQELDDIRAEIRTAIESEGGVCNKAAVQQFHMLDSLLREIGRWHPLSAINMSRVTLAEATIANGTVLPQGTVVALAPRATHYNADIYDQPDVFDPFRFSKLRQTAGGIDSKHAFTALSNDYLLFGVGRHACPGRFFAALMIKVILAEILLNYDISYPSGEKRRPKGIPFNLFTTPSPFAKLAFSRRMKA